MPSLRRRAARSSTGPARATSTRTSAFTRPFERDGLDFWWLDYCCDESYALAPGLTQDSWINRLYARRKRRARQPLAGALARRRVGVRSRRGAARGIWAEHRNAIHFTGDARPTWSMLDFQTLFSRRRGQRRHPLRLARHRRLRLDHERRDSPAATSPTTSTCAGCSRAPSSRSSACTPITATACPGTTRKGARRSPRSSCGCAARSIPTRTRWRARAYDSGPAAARRMYLAGPSRRRLPHDRQYMLGPRPARRAGRRPRATRRSKKVWFPPGRWIDIFTGRALQRARRSRR